MSDTIVVIEPKIQTITVSYTQSYVVVVSEQPNQTITSPQQSEVMVVNESQIQTIWMDGPSVYMPVPTIDEIYTISSVIDQVVLVDNSQIQILTAGTQGPAGQGWYDILAYSMGRAA